MKKEQDEEFFIPFMDCPQCGTKNTPLSFKGYTIPENHPLHTKLGSEISIVHCPVCDRVPYDESEIKGYLSEQEMKDMGWVPEDEMSLFSRLKSNIRFFVGRKRWLIGHKLHKLFSKEDI